MIIRDTAVNLALGKMIDILFLSMTASRTAIKAYPRTTRHIEHTIRYIRGEIRSELAKQQLNEIEIRVFDRLMELYNVLSSRSEASANQIPRLIQQPNDIRALLTRTEIHVQELAYASLVLSALGQFDYDDTSLVLPSFSLHSSGLGYYRGLRRIDGSKAKFSKNDPRTPATCWYQMFRGFILDPSKKPREILGEILTTLHIDLLPDRESGIGITCFPITALFKNGSDLSEYVSSNGFSVLDGNYIGQELGISNPTFSRVAVLNTNDIMQSGWIPATEAAEDEAQDEADEEPDNTDTEITDEEVSDKDEEDPSETDEQVTEQPLDNPDDESGDDIEEKPNKSKPILGLTIKLAQDETLDEYLYKLKALNFIDNTIELNHDELSAEIVTLLKEWKNQFLFLASAEETEKLLKSLKIEL